MSTNVRQLFDLEGKTALITGGSRGLGLQIAEALGEAGARVMLTSRKAADLEQAAAALAARGIDAAWIDADARDPDAVQRVADAAMARLGQIDILVNNAGATWGAKAEDLRTAFVKPDGGGDRLNADTGARYRREVLARGGEVEPAELVRRFLGRPSDSRAFFRALEKR